MKVLVDALSAKVGGGVIYVESLLGALVALHDGTEYHVLLSPQYQRDLMDRLPAGLTVVPVDLPATPVLKRWVFEHGRLPKLVRDGCYDVLFTVTEIAALFPGCPSVVTAHNFIIYAPLSLRDRWREKVELAVYRMVRWPLAALTLHRADGIVFVSRVFADHVCRQLSIRSNKAHVVHHGVSLAFRPEAAGRPLPSSLEGLEFILAVSSLERHKNYATLIEAFAAIRSRPEGGGVHLVIAGAPSAPEVAKRLRSLGRSLGLEASIHFLGAVPHDELPALFSRARAFVLPSLTESYGLPLLEAMACGAPVIASDLPVAREVCGDAALFFHPRRSQELAGHLASILSDRALASDLSARSLARAAGFSWSIAAARTATVLREVAAR